MIQLGIVGACGRGSAYGPACESCSDRLSVRAVCDVNADGLERAQARFGAEFAFADYEEMLEKGGVDAVAVGTPMPFHVPQSIAALQRGIHVISEVPAGVTIHECRDLVQAARNSGAVYMMAENFIYLRTNILIRELVRRGEFGEVYYAEGEYIHELKKLNEVTPWRRRWQTGIDGITYPTHSLGPILQWFEGQRVVSVCCAGSGHHFKDPRGDEYENQDTCVMLCKMSGGGLVKIRVDMLSDRPHNMVGYSLQGTLGSYESARSASDKHRVFLGGRHPHGVLDDETHDFQDTDGWQDLELFADDLLPDWYTREAEQLKKAGHEGSDYFGMRDLLDAIDGKHPPPFGIHEAMDLTLPGLVSQQSIQQGGAWLAVPDSRTWKDGRYDVPLIMTWPAGRRVPDIAIPNGYKLRQYDTADEGDYIALAEKAGFRGWSGDTVGKHCESIIPRGFFVIEHEDSRRVVASAQAGHHPAPGLPHAGEVGWVIGDPEHRGRGLGRVVTAAVLRRFLEAGYENIYLRTDDWRLPAMKIYLDLGLEPRLGDDGMADRWEKVKQALR